LIWIIRDLSGLVEMNLDWFLLLFGSLEVGVDLTPKVSGTNETRNTG